MDARVFRIESSAHNVTPITVRTMPAMGRRGIRGQRTMRMRLMTPPKMMIIMPASKSVRREKKPTAREIRRSRNI